jgi:hypothetical protein
VPAGGSEDDGSGETPGATGNQYYESGIAKGGVRGGAGGNGKAVLIFTIPSETKIKAGGVWKGVNDIKYKVSGVWKKITHGYYKVSGAWKAIFTGDVIFVGNSAAFGNNSGGATSGVEGSGGLPTPASIPPQEGNDRFFPPVQKIYWRPNPHTTSGFSRADEPTGVSRKIVCTMMNDTYGFGSFRNRIWLRHSRDLPKEYEIGYHTIFLPLVNFAKKPGKVNAVVKSILEHIARHRTYDIRQQMKNKIHWRGRIYRKILEPICYFVGRIKAPK